MLAGVIMLGMFGGAGYAVHELSRDPHAGEKAIINRRAESWIADLKQAGFVSRVDVENHTVVIVPGPKWDDQSRQEQQVVSGHLADYFLGHRSAPVVIQKP